MTRFLLLLLPLLFVACSGRTGKVDEQTTDSTALAAYYWQKEELPPLVVSGDQGVSAALLNFVGGRLMLAGGANFPDTPASQGGRKRIYDNIYVLADTTWLLTDFHLPQPIAYAATASTPRGLAVLGGNNGSELTSKAYIWTPDGHFEPLPDLPLPTENAAAAYGDGYLYIIGGQTPSSPVNSAYRLLLDGSPSNEWQPLPSVPREARVQPSAAYACGRVYVGGGYNPTDGTVNGTLFALETDSLKWRFIDSLHLPDDDVKVSTLVGASMHYCPQLASLLMLGGVDAGKFQKAISRPFRIELAREANKLDELSRLQSESQQYLLHEPQWYAFNRDLTAKCIATESSPYTRCYTDETLARAGAATLLQDSLLYVVGGELKPGLRASTASLFKLRRVEIKE